MIHIHHKLIGVTTMMRFFNVNVANLTFLSIFISVFGLLSVPSQAWSVPIEDDQICGGLQPSTPFNTSLPPGWDFAINKNVITICPSEQLRGFLLGDSCSDGCPLDEAGVRLYGCHGNDPKIVRMICDSNSPSGVWRSCTLHGGQTNAQLAAIISGKPQVGLLPGRSLNLHANGNLTVTKFKWYFIPEIEDPVNSWAVYQGGSGKMRPITNAERLILMMKKKPPLGQSQMQKPRCGCGPRFDPDNLLDAATVLGSISYSSYQQGMETPGLAGEGQVLIGAGGMAVAGGLGASAGSVALAQAAQCATYAGLVGTAGACEAGAAGLAAASTAGIVGGLALCAGGGGLLLGTGLDYCGLNPFTYPAECIGSFVGSF